MAKKSRKKFGLAFDSGLKLICDAPGKNLPYTRELSNRWDKNWITPLLKVDWYAPVS